MLRVENLTVRLGGLSVLDNVSFTLKENCWTMLIGPNGAGKSTVVNAVSQTIPYTGLVSYKGADLKKMSASDTAKHIGVLTQSHHVAYNFSVYEIVKLGRYSRAGIWGKDDADGDAKVKNALDITGMSELSLRSVLTLSGGELQRTFLAQVFAQDPEILILDEPANSLDLIYQKQIFELLKNWLRQPGHAILSVVHDLGLAYAYGTDAVLLNDGSVVSHGSMNGVITEENLNAVYGPGVREWMREIHSVWDE